MILALEATDPAAESVGETRTRMILSDGGVPFRSQVRIADALGLIGRVDFLVDDALVVEFDGMVKYGGEDGNARLADEKIREDRLRRAGYEVERVIWRDLEEPVAVLNRVEQARRMGRERAAARQRADGWA